MNQQVYIDEILESILKPLIQIYEDFVLEKSGDLSYNQRKWAWILFSLLQLCEIAPIDNCWQPL